MLDTGKLKMMMTPSVFIHFSDVGLLSSYIYSPGIADFYAISFLYYSPIGLIVCMTVAMIVSKITGIEFTLFSMFLFA